MDDITARKLLGVSESASFNEIRSRFRKLAKQYHPDVSSANDPHNRFILISTAFLVLQGKEVGIQTTAQLDEDISFAVNLKAEIDNYFDTTLIEFLARTSRLQRRTTSYLKEVIFSARSSSELKQLLDRNVAHYLTETSAEISTLLQQINEEIRASEDNFMFNFFRNMYQLRRSYWLFNLYRNPVAVSEFVGFTRGCLFALLFRVACVSPRASRFGFALVVSFCLCGNRRTHLSDSVFNAKSPAAISTPTAFS